MIREICFITCRDEGKIIFNTRNRKKTQYQTEIAAIILEIS